MLPKTPELARQRLNFNLELRTFAKRETLANSRFKGKLSADTFSVEQTIQGHDVRKIHKDGDFVVQKKDIFGNKIGKPKVYEIKTGNSKLSKAHKKNKKRLEKNLESLPFLLPFCEKR